MRSAWRRGYRRHCVRIARGDAIEPRVTDERKILAREEALEQLARIAARYRMWHLERYARPCHQRAEYDRPIEIRGQRLYGRVQIGIHQVDSDAVPACVHGRLGR